jgi:hypothetical protein
MGAIIDRREYEGGAILNPNEGLIRISRRQKSLKSWFELFAEFLEQPNVSEVQAISIGWWMDDPENEDGEEYDYQMDDYDLTDGSFDKVIEAIVSSRFLLKNLKILFIGDFGYEGDDFYYDDGTDFPSLNLNLLLQSFNNLEYLGVSGVSIEDLGSLNSGSLKKIEISEIFSAGDYFEYEPSDNLTILDQLKTSNLPELEIIHLMVYPYSNFDLSVELIRQENPFPKLCRIHCPRPYTTSDAAYQEGGWYNYENVAHVFNQLHDYVSPYLNSYSSVRMDFTGE